MPANPMQRKVRNSFLLGILVMLVIAIFIGVIVFFIVIKPNINENKNKLTAYVYKIKEGASVEYGEKITESMVESVEIPVATETNTTGFILAKKQNAEGKTVDAAFPDGYKSRLDLAGGTILTKGMLYKEEISSSLRYTEYNMITIPADLNAGDFIDIRLRLSNTQDLIVVAKKEIVNLHNTTVGLHLTEEEILLLNSAIVETYAMNGAAELYMTRYVDENLQEQATYTYSPTEEVVNLIKANPNIVATAKETIANAYYDSGVIRNPINNIIGQYADQKNYNIEAGIQKQIEDARKARESYLSGLNGY